MKVRIDSDEQYPVYSVISDGADLDVEISEETFARWKRVEAEHDAVQDEMAEAKRIAENTLQSPFE